MYNEIYFFVREVICDVIRTAHAFSPIPNSTILIWYLELIKKLFILYKSDAILISFITIVICCSSGILWSHNGITCIFSVNYIKNFLKLINSSINYFALYSE